MSADDGTLSPAWGKAHVGLPYHQNKPWKLTPDIYSYRNRKVTAGTVSRDATPGEEWERGYRRQWCMPADLIGVAPELEGFGRPSPIEKRSAFDNCYATLADDTFDHGGQSYALDGIYHYTRGLSFVIDFKRAVPRARPDTMREGWFSVDGRTFAVDDALRYTTGALTIPAAPPCSSASS